MSAGFYTIVLCMAVPCLAACTGCVTDSNRNSRQKTWNLVFEEDFNGTSIDTAAWFCTEQGVNYTNEDQAYIKKQVCVSGGFLVLCFGRGKYPEWVEVRKV
jgi:hypothetical protein